MKLTRLKLFLLPVLFYLFITSFWMRGWINGNLPLSPREENVQELSYLWNLYHQAERGTIFNGWSIDWENGMPNTIQRGYLFLSPLAYFSYHSGISPDHIYKITVGLIFLLSALGMFGYVYLLSQNYHASLVGGLIYLIFPSHLAIGLETIDFNIYWSLFPWLFFSLEFFVKRRKAFISSVMVGLFLTLSLILGNTYFIATVPFISIYFLLRILLTGKKNLFRFIFSTIIIFLGLSAFTVIPFLFENPVNGISIAASRVQTFETVRLENILHSYFLRLINSSPVEFHIWEDFPSMSWYLGVFPLVLSLIFLVRGKKLGKLLVPLIIIALLAGVVLNTGDMLFNNNLLSPVRAVYDRTFRLLIILAFVISAAAGFGWSVAGLVRRQKVFFFISVIILLYEFIPFSQMFRSTGISLLAGKAERINKFLAESSREDRYYSPYPLRYYGGFLYSDFSQKGDVSTYHLPKYRLEYLTRYLNQPRANSPFLYLPYAVKYSSIIYDVILLGTLETGKFDENYIDTILRWGNIRWVILHPDTADYKKAQVFLEKKEFDKVLSDKDLLIYNRQGKSDNVSFSDTYSVVPKGEDENIFYWLNLHQEGKSGVVGKIEAKADSEGKGDIISFSLTRMSPDRIKVAYLSTGKKLLTVSESWYPGWKVYLDGHERPLLRANFAYLGMIVPPGNHQVEFIYKKPTYYYFSYGLSLITASVIIFFLWRKYKVEKRDWQR